MDEHLGKEMFSPKLESLQKVIASIKSEIQGRGIKVIIVAGTNGKGETCHSLSSYFDGRVSYGLWTSPHVLSIRERLIFDGAMISIERMSFLLEETLNYVDGLQVKLSYYEFLLVAFLREALSRRVEALVLEVGIGGRLDGVNMIDPDLTAITSIARDHENVLGVGFRKILFEKLGITRPGVPLVTSLESQYLRSLVESFTKTRNIIWRDLFAEGFLSPDSHYSTRNLLLARCLAERFLGGHFPKTPPLENEMMTRTTPGRMDHWRVKGVNWTFSGSHNLDGTRKLVQRLENEHRRFDFVLCAFSVRPEREVRSMLVLLADLPVTEGVWGTTFSHHKAMSLKNIQQTVPDLPQLHWVEDWKNWCSRQAVAPVNILVTGSYYFVGEVMSHILASDDPAVLDTHFDDFHSSRRR
jgi:dihydrofolate synthase/folylpolyglutamate synthase